MSISRFYGVSRANLLSTGQCTKVVSDLLRLKDSWCKRSRYGFWTLGTAAYLDAISDPQRYFESAAQTNQVLFDHFRYLLDQLKNIMSRALDAPCDYDRKYALPGFHIFQYNGEDRLDAAYLAQRAHFDRQFQLIMDESSVEETLSFTLLVEAPSCGAFLAVWPLTYRDSIANIGTISKSAEEMKPYFLQYQLGHVLWHDGMILHALAPSGSDSCVGHRITLQGHGVRGKGTWLLYW
jgi:hypothetical protein